ncbi:MAG: DUF1573 domain-containing protein [Candidatus Brocadiaceae bacterium]|nr:DUF1573 domain-containing protein [Candidatus Brocadiaceae bacterium]
MKKYKIIFIVFLTGLMLKNIQIVFAEEKKTEINVEKPKIKFEEISYDFGEIYTDETVKHVFKFKNIGNGELIIEKVKSSCGCTAALISKKTLKKGEEGEVDVTYRSGKYPGKANKTISVYSNDPENIIKKLTIKGNIIEEVTVEPKKINFGVIRKGEESTKELIIESIPGKEINIMKLESPNPYVKITPFNGAKHRQSYHITVSKEDVIGRFNGVIFIYTNSDKQKKIDIPFFGEIAGDITFYPKRLFFLANLKDKHVVKKTVILTFINKDVKIKKIEIDPDVMDYTISELNEKTKKIEVKIDRVNTTGKMTGSLNIYTNSSMQPVINIPVYSTIKG